MAAHHAVECLPTMAWNTQLVSRASPFLRTAAAGSAPIALEALGPIGLLYAIEDEIRGADSETRRAVRQQKSRPVLETLEPWLRAKLSTISQKS